MLHVASLYLRYNLYRNLAVALKNVAYAQRLLITTQCYNSSNKQCCIFWYIGRYPTFIKMLCCPIFTILSETQYMSMDLHGSLMESTKTSYFWIVFKNFFRTIKVLLMQFKMWNIPLISLSLSTFKLPSSRLEAIDLRQKVKLQQPVVFFRNIIALYLNHEYMYCIKLLMRFAVNVI